MSIPLEPRRLILVGGGPQEYWEPFVAAVAEDHEVAIVAPDYPSWQAKYVQKHRISKITNTSTLFAAVADLRGEVSEAAVLTWEADSALPVARIAERLRLRSMSIDTVQSCLDSRDSAGAVDPAGVELTVYSVARAGRPDLACVVQSGQLVESWRAKSWTGQVDALVRDAHESVGAGWGLTTTRLSVTGDDVRLIGISTWLDQDALPLLNSSTAGKKLARLSAAVLFDPEPAVAAA